MRTRTMLYAAPILAAGLLNLARPAVAQEADPTPTEIAAQCLDNAGLSFVRCTERSNWIGDMLCAVKYAADAILCVPGIVVGGAKE